MASGSSQPARERDNNEEEENAYKDRAKKAYERLQSLATAMGTREVGRVAQRLTKWGNALHMQWKEVNDTVTTQMVRDIWPCKQSETKKGRWKVTRCRNEEIKNNAETIAMEVFGHPLHNHDAPLYFAKMLYMQFELHQPVDFSSKEPPQSLVDVKNTSLTLTKSDLDLALEGAKLELSEQKEALERSLLEKEREAQRILESSTPQREHQLMREQLTSMQREVSRIGQRQPAPTSTSHMMNMILHPDAVVAPTGASSSDASVCPSCTKPFDSWSGHYKLACGHYYHLACLVRSMVLGEKCAICSVPYPTALFKMFSLQVPEPKDATQRQTDSSVIRNLNINFDNEGETGF